MNDDIVLISIPETTIRNIIRSEFERALKEIAKEAPKETNEDFSKKYISRQDFMKERNIQSDSTPWTWENQGKLKPYKFGKEIFYLRVEVEALIKRSR